METIQTNNQQRSSNSNILERSETIPNGSTQEIVEAVPALPDKAGGNDIVQKSTAFYKYINKANQMFDNKFDYSKFVYVTAKTKSIIICPIHGEYLQNMDKHTAKNSKGCAQCWNDSRPFPSWFKGKDCTPFSVFKIKADKIFPNLYEYDEKSYNGISKDMLITCKKHGIFKILPSNFLKSKLGCPLCGSEGRSVTKTKSVFNFLETANLIHDDAYAYPELDVLYKNRKSIIKIECAEHGIFTKKAQKHLAGQGCFECKIKSLIQSDVLVGGYSDNLFEVKPFLKEKPAILYLLKINNYYKIGITSTAVTSRINSLKSKAKQFSEIINIEILNTKNDTLFNCFKMEQHILQENAKFRIFKKWSTELLTHIDVEKYF